ncbi:MAG TPA: alpha-amylase family glycosyl hydrolase [Luteimonas sp.]|nr:alpha-amylase family glycosyl hydrolase [Luteimonas sp.]
MARLFAAGLGLGSLASLAATAAAPADVLHVPSPQWRDQVVYFVMTDRFEDGDPSNNDQGTGEYDPADGAKFSGGDLAGLARRLDYVQGLGATAVWITPPVANQWWNPRVQYGGYHGYWASDFTAVDPHLGDLDDYRALSRALHGRGMYLVQDVVLNHVGDWFSYPHGWKPGDPAEGFVLTPDGQGRTAPARAPFSRNDARDPAQRAEGVYHWTPDITDYDDPRQLSDWQLAGLDDLDTANPEVRRALRAAYGGWIRDVGVDAFRLDTAFYVPHADLRDFMQSRDPQAPGMVEAAAATGREDFLVFGEGFGIDRGCEDVQERRIEGYVRDDDGPVLPGMLNFPLYGTLSEVFARGAPTARLGCRIRLAKQRHAHPELMPSFVDNHDVDRFLAGGSEAALKQALLAIMTLPGIPVVYYGTEQGFTGQRAAMFAGGFGSGGRDHFDTQAPLYRYLQGAIALRRGHRVFSRGTPTVLREDAAGAGALAYRMDGEGGAALVVFNTAGHEVLLDNLDTGLAPGSTLRGLFGIDGTPADVVVGRDGKVDLRLPARGGEAWQLVPMLAARAMRPDLAPARPGPAISLSPVPAAPFDGDFEVTGRAEGVESFRLVVDGDLASAQVVRPAADGSWKATVDTSAMLDPGATHALVAWSDAPAVASERREFRVARPWTLLADVADPEGDDHGPLGRYRYPTDASWGANRQLDIERVRTWGAGGALKIELRMHAVTSQWSPPNGFDHVAFTVFLQLPERSSGVDAMPLQNATLPGGMHWQYRLRANGWSNALFAAEGASASAEGRAVSPGAGILVDREARTISFVIPARALDNPATLSGARLYVSTWDYDAAPRPLRPDGGTHAFGGGDGSRDPLVMDDTGVIVLR